MQQHSADEIGRGRRQSGGGHSRRNCRPSRFSGGNSGRAKKASRREEEPQKLSVGSEAGKAWQARLGQSFNLARPGPPLQSAASKIEQAEL
jgi:hypothetical protein